MPRQVDPHFFELAQVDDAISATCKTCPHALTGPNERAIAHDAMVHAASHKNEDRAAKHKAAVADSREAAKAIAERVGPGDDPDPPEPEPEPVDPLEQLEDEPDTGR
jgi:hypothetical protein